MYENIFKGNVRKFQTRGWIWTNNLRALIRFVFLVLSKVLQSRKMGVLFLSHRGERVTYM